MSLFDYSCWCVPCAGWWSVLGRVYFSTWWCSLQLCLAVLALIVIGVNMHIDLDSAGSPPSGRPPLTVGLASRYILEYACTLHASAVLCLDVVSACTHCHVCVYVCVFLQSPVATEGLPCEGATVPTVQPVIAIGSPASGADQPVSSHAAHILPDAAGPHTCLRPVEGVPGVLQL